MNENHVDLLIYSILGYIKQIDLTRSNPKHNVKYQSQISQMSKPKPKAK